MAKTPIPFLLHIKEAIETISKYIGSYNLEQFKSDQKTQDAVIRQLEIIGEAAAKLEGNLKTEYPEIPWREISDFRNVLAHEYWDIDIEIVWKAATEEVQELRDTLLPIIKKQNLEK